MNKIILQKELSYKAVRSSGAGGQHVNKVSSKVILSFDLANSEGLSNREKSLLFKNLATRINGDKIISLTCDDSRSQLQNKTTVIKRFFELLEAGLKVPKRRIASKPSKASIRRMKEKKTRRGKLKSLRKKPGLD